MFKFIDECFSMMYVSHGQTIVVLDVVMLH